MRDAGNLIASVLTTALILAAYFLLGWMACGCAGPTREVVVQPQPVTPACLLVLGPPPKPTVTLRALSERCRDREGRRLHPDEPCLTADETAELVRSLAASMAYASTAFYACQIADPGLDGTGILP